jgi:phosphoglycolate phosphatase
LTNKPVNISVRILKGLGVAQYFRSIYGGNSFKTKKPDPEGAKKILNELSVAPGDTAMVGDSEVDVQTARNAGMASVCVNFGFGTHDRAAHPAEVCRLSMKSGKKRAKCLRRSAAQGRLCAC